MNIWTRTGKLWRAEAAFHKKPPLRKLLLLPARRSGAAPAWRLLTHRVIFIASSWPYFPLKSGPGSFSLAVVVALKCCRTACELVPASAEHLWAQTVGLGQGPQECGAAAAGLSSSWKRFLAPSRRAPRDPLKGFNFLWMYNFCWLTGVLGRRPFVKLMTGRSCLGQRLSNHHLCDCKSANITKEPKIPSCSPGVAVLEHRTPRIARDESYRFCPVLLFQMTVCFGLLKLQNVILRSREVRDSASNWDTSVTAGYLEWVHFPPCLSSLSCRGWEHFGAKAFWVFL